MTWGYHLIVDCSKCNIEAMKSKEHIDLFLQELIRVTKMKPMGAPYYQNVVTNKSTIKKDIAGYSVVQFIRTSSILLHFCNPSGSVYFDFFSCKKFSQVKVIDLLKLFFEPENVKVVYLERDAHI